MKRIGLIFSAIFISLASVVTILPNQAVAATDYGELELVNFLNVVSPDGTQSRDVSQGGGNSWTDIRLADSTRKTCAFQSQLTTALASGTVNVTLVTPQTGGNPGLMARVDALWPTQRPRSFVNIIFSTNPDQLANLLVGDDLTDILVQSTYNNGYYNATLYIDNDGTYIFNCASFSDSGCSYEYTNHTSSCTAFGSLTNWIAYVGTGWSYPPHQFYSYYTTFDIEYPEDWEQPRIPNEAPPPPVDGDGYAPQIGYNTTTENVLSGLYIGDTDICIPTTAGGCVTPMLRWSVYLEGSDEPLNTKATELFTPYSFKLPGNDTYIFKISYTNPGVPFAPFDPEINLITTQFTINANGTFVVGSTVLNGCETTGSTQDCGEADPLEDCTTYGLDIGGYFQCIINNFGIWLRNSLIDLFVPKYSFFTAWNSSFQTFMNDKLGFVYTSIGFIGTLFTGMVTGASTPRCLVEPGGSFFGATFTVDVCTIQDLIGNTAFGILQGIVIASTVVLVILASYRKYQEVTEKR